MADASPKCTSSVGQSTTPEAPRGEGGPGPKPKKSLYQRYVDAKSGRNVRISNADLLKHTGMTREQLKEWSKDRPGVAGNQLAGKLTIGPATGLGNTEASQGAEGDMKFPPKPRQEEKTVDEDDD